MGSLLAPELKFIDEQTFPGCTEHDTLLERLRWRMDGGCVSGLSVDVSDYSDMVQAVF